MGKGRERKIEGKRPGKECSHTHAQFPSMVREAGKGVEKKEKGKEEKESPSRVVHDRTKVDGKERKKREGEETTALFFKPLFSYLEKGKEKKRRKGGNRKGSPTSSSLSPKRSEGERWKKKGKGRGGN